MLEFLRGFMPLICMIAGFLIGILAGRDNDEDNN